MVKESKFYIKFFMLAMPIVLQSLISTGINMMDTVMLGSFGDYYLSASSLSNQFYHIFQILCMGFGFGAAVLTAQAWGRHEITEIKKTITLMLRSIMVIGIFFMIFTILFPRQIMEIYTTDIYLVECSLKYWHFLSYCFIFQGISLTLTIVLRSFGSSNIPLYSSILSFFVNIFFNWVFIFGKLGAPQMGIEGAAIGTLIARICECVFIFSYMIFFDKKVKYKIQDLLLPCGDILSRFIQYGLPVIVSDLLLAIGNNMVAMIMGHIGVSFVAAFSITSVLQQLLTVFNQGIAQAGCMITGNTLGEHQIDKAYEQGKTFLIISLGMGLICSALLFLFKMPMIQYYQISDETREIAISLMNGICFIVPFQLVGSVMTKGVLRGGGDTKFLMKADILFLWCASIPLGYLAGLVWSMPAFWIYLFLKIDNIIKSIWCVFRLKSRKWINIIE